MKIDRPGFYLVRDAAFDRWDVGEATYRDSRLEFYLAGCDYVSESEWDDVRGPLDVESAPRFEPSYPEDLAEAHRLVQRVEPDARIEEVDGYRIVKARAPLVWRADDGWENPFSAERAEHFPTPSAAAADYARRKAEAEKEAARREDLAEALEILLPMHVYAVWGAAVGWKWALCRGGVAPTAS